MIAIIRGSQVDISVTTVILAEDSHDPLGIKAWHCPICQNTVFQHGGQIIKIMPGSTPVTTLPVICQCDNCKHKYLIERVAIY